MAHAGEWFCFCPRCGIELEVTLDPDPPLADAGFYCETPGCGYKDWVPGALRAVVRSYLEIPLMSECERAARFGRPREQCGL